MEPTAQGASPTQQLATYLLGQDVSVFVAEHRAQGESYRMIARALWTATDGAIDVTPETLRLWHGAA